MKKHQNQYVTGIITGAAVAFIATLFSYWIVSSVSQGVAISTLLVIVSCTGMLVGAAMSYLVSRAEKGAHFELRR